MKFEGAYEDSNCNNQIEYKALCVGCREDLLNVAATIEYRARREWGKKVERERRKKSYAEYRMSEATVFIRWYWKREYRASSDKLDKFAVEYEQVFEYG